MGRVTDIDLALYDDNLSLNEVLQAILGLQHGRLVRRIFRGYPFFGPRQADPQVPGEDGDLLYKEPTKIYKVRGSTSPTRALIPRIRSRSLSKEVGALQPRIRAFVEQAVTFGVCPECDGTRLSKEARSSKITSTSIADACAMQISDLAD